MADGRGCKRTGTGGGAIGPIGRVRSAAIEVQQEAESLSTMRELPPGT